VCFSKVLYRPCVTVIRLNSYVAPGLNSRNCKQYITAALNSFPEETDLYEASRRMKKHLRHSVKADYLSWNDTKKETRL
jgi:hypothetical protein